MYFLHDYPNRDTRCKHAYTMKISNTYWNKRTTHEKLFVKNLNN